MGKFIKTLSCLLVSSIIFANSTIGVKADDNYQTENKVDLSSEEDFDNYVKSQILSEGDEIIASKDFYFKINAYNSSDIEIVSEEEYDKAEEKNSTFSGNPFDNSRSQVSTYSTNAGSPINLPDRYDWIRLKLNVFSLGTPIKNNHYGFSANYQWKRKPHIIAGKDVFGIANDGNVSFDASTVNGQSIAPTTLSPYGEVKSYSSKSADIVEDITGIAFKHKLSTGKFDKVTCSGYICVYGNTNQKYSTIGVSYAHSQLTGSASVSFNAASASINVTPSLSFDTITQTASIKFK